LRAGFLVTVFLFGERRFVAAAARFFGDRLLVAADAGFAPLVRFFAAPIAAPVTAPSTVPTTGAPRAVPATAPATAPPSVLFVVPETASLSPSSLSLSSISISVLLELSRNRNEALKFHSQGICLITTSDRALDENDPAIRDKYFRRPALPPSTYREDECDC
jgi:hypothetical protein